MHFAPLLFLSLITYALPVAASTSDSESQQWQSYPTDLPQFDYSGDKLRAHWPQLTAGSQLPFPDAAYLQEYCRRYPKLLDYSLTLAAQPDSHPALAAMQQQNFLPLARAVQQVWRLHYQGEFEQAWMLGQQLGPTGVVPGLYAKMMYATQIVSDQKEKLHLLQEAADTSQKLLPLAPDDAFASFGLAYARARILELQTTAEATNSAYLGETLDAMKSLCAEHPDNPLYPAATGGIQAGIVSRVGSFIGRLTYGATEERAIASFQQALMLGQHLPVIYFEYARALGMIDPEKYLSKQLELIAGCLKQKTFSAEEALNQQHCQELQQTLTGKHTDTTHD